MGRQGLEEEEEEAEEESVEGVAVKHVEEKFKDRRKIFFGQRNQRQTTTKRNCCAYTLS